MNKVSVSYGGGGLFTVKSILASHLAAPVLILGVFNLMMPRFIDRPLLREWTVQSLIVDQTHLVLVSGKLVLQKVSVSFRDNSIHNAQRTLINWALVVKW